MFNGRQCSKRRNYYTSLTVSNGRFSFPLFVNLSYSSFVTQHRIYFVKDQIQHILQQIIPPHPLASSLSAGSIHSITCLSSFFMHNIPQKISEERLISWQLCIPRKVININNQIPPLISHISNQIKVEQIKPQCLLQ